MTISHVNHEQAKIVGTTRDANSSAKVKLVKFLNKFGVICIVLNTSQTLGFESMDCPAPSSISWDVKNSWELQGTTMQWKIAMSSLSISSKYLLITWSRSEMITIIRRSITLIWRRHLWFQMKMKKEMFGMNSLNSPHENLSYTL